MKRASYQNGSVALVKRAGTDDRWVFRWYEVTLSGERIQRAATFADVRQCPTKAAAQRLADKIMRPRLRELTLCVHFGELADKYEADDMPTRKSTVSSYRSSLKRLRARFGATRLDHMAQNPLEIQAWMSELKTEDGSRPLSQKSRRNLKAILHRIFECAMMWGLLDIGRNPVELVRLKHRPAGSRKPRRPVVITIAQFEALMDDEELSRHCKTMALIAMATGVRASELLGLKWADIDFDDLCIHIRRSVVGRHEDLPKTENSEASVPMHPDVAEVLIAWKHEVYVVGDWVFGSLLTGRPFHRDALLKDHLRPAGNRAGIPSLGWHSFRHTYRAMLADLELPLEVQKQLMRHAHIETTLKYGAQSDQSTSKNRAANARVVEMLPVRRKA